MTEAANTLLTADMLAPVSEAITSNLAVVIPAGIAVFAIVVALRVGINVLRSLVHG